MQVSLSSPSTLSFRMYFFGKFLFFLLVCYIKIQFIWSQGLLGAHTTGRDGNIEGMEKQSVISPTQAMCSVAPVDAPFPSLRPENAPTSHKRATQPCPHKERHPFYQRIIIISFSTWREMCGWPFLCNKGTYYFPPIVLRGFAFCFLSSVVLFWQRTDICIWYVFLFSPSFVRSENLKNQPTPIFIYAWKLRYKAQNIKRKVQKKKIASFFFLCNNSTLCKLSCEFLLALWNFSFSSFFGSAQCYVYIKR